MGPEAVNKNKDCVFQGDYTGRDKITNIIMYQESEREFVVTHNANIRPVAYFTGRETELQELRQRIEAGRKSVLVSGMGGIGKTHICRKLFEEYSNRHAEGGNIPFRHIGYIEYDRDMDSSLQNCLKYKEQDSPEKNREAAWSELEYLASDGKLLLFVDNVNKPMWEDDGLNRLNTIPGAIVLTSRRTSFGGAFEAYRLGFLSTEECMEVYEKVRFENSGMKVGTKEIPDLEYVIENLAGRHTITVEHLAHLARTKHWTIKRLRGELEEKGFCLEFHKNGEIINIQKAYEVLYDLSKLTEAEQNILEAFSVFPYIPLAAETCNEWMLADAGVSEEDDILIGLYEKGWLQFDVEQESYALHPVFGQFIYDRCKPESQNHLGLIESCRKSLEIPESGSALEGQKFIPFAEKMIEKLNMGEDIGQIGFIYSIAYLLYYVSEYKKAEELYAKSLRIGKKVLGENHLSTAISYNNLAVVYKSQGEYEKAEELYEKSLRICKKVLGENHPATTTNYFNLAWVYEGRGEYKKAVSYCFKAYKVFALKLGINHPDTQIIYKNMKIVYFEWNPKGNFKQWLEEKMKE